MSRFRFSILSALSALTLSIASFALILILLVAGSRPGQLEDAFLFKINATELGSDIIRFERVTSTASTTPSATPTSSNPFDKLNPFSTASPLNPNNRDSLLGDLQTSLEPLANNITDAIDNGLGNAVTEVVDGLVNSTGVRDFYFLYISSVCEGPLRNDSRGNASDTQMEKCTSYEEIMRELNASSPNVQSSVVIGNTNISVPLIAEGVQALGSLSSTLNSLRTGVLVFLFVAVIGSGAIIVLIPLALLTRNAQLVVYANLFFSQLAASAGFTAALLLTILIKGLVGMIGGVGKTLSLVIDKGNTAIALAWISWAFSLLVAWYWVTVWFVVSRSWSFVKRDRSDDEIGNWGGIAREIKRDLSGKMK